MCFNHCAYADISSDNGLWSSQVVVISDWPFGKWGLTKCHSSNANVLAQGVIVISNINYTCLCVCICLFLLCFIACDSVLQVPFQALFLLLEGASTPAYGLPVALTSTAFAGESLAGQEAYFM